jgi:hypothetical protein
VDNSLTTARETLDEVAGLRRRTRLARQAFWFPLILFGLLTLASGPLYVGHPRPYGRILVFWLIAAPAAYIATGAFYRWWARRRGVATTWRTFVVTGICLFMALAALAWNDFRILPVVNALSVHGLFPLVLVALGFGVLAVAERSVSLGVFAVGFFALVLIACLYDMENTLQRLNSTFAFGQEVNVYVCGSVLLLAGIVFGIIAASATTAILGARLRPMRRRPA